MNNKRQQHKSKAQLPIQGKNNKFGWSQGTYIPQKPEKCLNNRKYDSDPLFRSSWERRVMYYMDTNTNVIEWSAELPIHTIPYDYIDGKTHRYIPDIYAKVRSKDGNVKEWLIEVKPYKETLAPKEPVRKTAKAMRNYHRNLKTYTMNQCKWQTANIWCQKRGMQFKVFTEKTIFDKL